uniref:Reverse transcriptase domain-containing protein n=1 Tax=Tanacetum cinerariifolium TaxID=118510 RepID=A0A6L2JA96_TANCI|nr:reverse transcriptase domain-containing protein [Tanacetum cinerariifolium]
MDATVVEDRTHHRSVMKNPWEDLRMKKQTMPTEHIKETNTVRVPDTGITVNKEMTTKISNLEKTTLPIHQHSKRNSMSPTLKKPCENLWSLKNRRMTLSKINSSTSKPKLSKDKRVTKLRFKTLKQSLVDSPTNVPLDQLTYDPPANPNAKTIVIYDDGEDEADEAEKKVELSSSKQAKSDRHLSRQEEVEDNFEELPNEEYLRIKTSIKDPPTDLEMKPLPKHLEYAFQEKDYLLPVIISALLKTMKRNVLFTFSRNTKKRLLRKHMIFWALAHLSANKKSTLRTMPNPSFKDNVSLVHCIPKKGGITVVTNEKNELVPTRTITGWRVCIDYRKLDESTRKDQFPLPFMDQMLERLARNKFFCFLDGFSGYFQILIEPTDQVKTTFTYPYGTYAYKHMPFGLWNAPATF